MLYLSRLVKIDNMQKKEGKNMKNSILTIVLTKILFHLATVDFMISKKIYILLTVFAISVLIFIRLKGKPERVRGYEENLVQPNPPQPQMITM